MSNKISIPLILIVLASAIIGWYFLLPNTLEPTTHIYGQLIDKDGDPVLRSVRMYFIDAREKPEGDVISIEGDKINIPSLYTKDPKNEHPTNEDGSFEFIIPNGEYYVAFQSYWEPLNPPMNGRIGFLDELGRPGESSKPTFGTISLVGEPQELTIKIHNNGYESKKESLTMYTIRPGDTLWSIAEQYYGSGDQWALIARLNDIELLPNKSILIEPGQIIKIPHKGWYETDEVAQNLRTIVHSGEFNKTITYQNQEYEYQLNYPGFWIIEDIERLGSLHGKRVLGPTINIRMNSFSPQPSYVDILIYDNTQKMTLEEFLIDKKYASKVSTKKEGILTKPFGNGGILLGNGTLCTSTFCDEHIAFFKDDNIYMVSFPVLDWLKEDVESVYNEIQYILNEFTLLDTK